MQNSIVCRTGHLFARESLGDVNGPSRYLTECGERKLSNADEGKVEGVRKGAEAGTLDGA